LFDGTPAARPKRTKCRLTVPAIGSPTPSPAQLPFAGYPVSDCWYSVKPIALHTEATIQKRRMIFVSDHARSSK
jgi:hypothetical protein